MNGLTRTCTNPMAQGRTIAEFPEFLGHPGFVTHFNYNMRGVAGIVGVTGNSQGAPRALILPPDRFVSLTNTRPANVGMGRKQANQAGIRRGTPVIIDRGM